MPLYFSPMMSSRDSTGPVSYHPRRTTWCRYSAKASKALADRLAEAFAEYLHHVVRRGWYETGPVLSREDIIGEKYRGIRPAYGYPACPDHSEKFKLFDLLDARSIGMELTESGAMT